ncbi:MAG: hypothetical protein QXW75_00545 [Thermoplasmatales archaeon]
MTEQEMNGKEGIKEGEQTEMQGTGDSMGAPDSNTGLTGMVSGAGVKRESPLERFFVVELTTEGFNAQVSFLEEHVRSAFFRMSADQRAKADYQKVRFYRACSRLASFKLDKQWVIPRDRLNDVEDAFKKILVSFESVKNEIYKELTLNWSTIVAEVYKKYPTFPIPRDRIDEIRPQSPSFLSMNYHVRALISVLNEMKGLREVLASSDLNPDIANRVEQQRMLLASKIRFEYEVKMTKMQETIDKLKAIAKKKGKRYEKLSVQAMDTKQDLEEMAEIIGEKDMIKTRLEGMLEFLAEGIKNDGAKAKEAETAKTGGDVQ